MIVVTDRGADLAPQQLAGLDIHFLSLTITLGGRSYISGVDIQPQEFYALLAATEEMPTTSLPSPGEFIALYRELAQRDPEIVSLHISSGLSGTYHTAVEAAKMVPEAHITVIDTLTLSAAEGWQVEAAARPDGRLVRPVGDPDQCLIAVRDWRPEVVIIDLTSPMFAGALNSRHAILPEGHL